ncbi:MAG: alpha/beta hydrolase [Sphingomonadales bacterium]|nr:MAG: alpha/beta hydrolase [Sphingomonadales bacterium]
MTQWFEGAGGIRLAATCYGPEEGAPVVLIGGLGQIRHSWKRAADLLAIGGRRAITLDLRGHGESGWSPDGVYDYPRLVEDLVAVVRQLGRPAALVGASLGGKVALATAGYGGQDVACALAMVDTAPRTRPSGVREVIGPMQDRSGFASPDAAAEAVARNRGRDPEPGAGEKLRRNLRVDAEGRWHWHWDPVLMDRDHGLGMLPALEYLELAAARLEIPVLLGRGEMSPVTSDEGVDAFKALVPQTVVEIIPGARHMIVGDENDVFAAGLIRFLDTVPQLRTLAPM